MRCLTTRCGQAKSPLEGAGSVPRPALHTFYSGSPKLKLIIFFAPRICRIRKTFPEVEQTLTVFPWSVCHNCDQIEPSVFNIEHLASNDQAGRPKRPTLKVNADLMVDTSLQSPWSLVTHVTYGEGQERQCYQPFPPSFLFFHAYFEPKLFQ